MTDIKTLALKYGGYTSLDKVYLDQLLAGKTEQEQLALITPPPSVVNAYFAELYQKKSPEAATDYFAELSQKLRKQSQLICSLKLRKFSPINSSLRSLVIFT